MDADTRDYINSLEDQDERLETAAADLRAIADDLDGLAPLIANHAVKLDGVATILRERRDRIRAIAARLEE